MRLVMALLAGAIVFPLHAQEKPRVYVAPSASWRLHQPVARADEAELQSRAEEVSAEFGHSCGGAIVTANFDAASYVVELTRRVKPIPLTRVAVTRTDVSIYRPEGDLVAAASKSSVRSAVKAACEAISKDWPTNVRQSSRSSVKTTAYPQ